MLTYAQQVPKMRVVKNQLSPSIILGLLVKIDNLYPKEAPKNAHTSKMIFRLMCITDLTIELEL